MDNPNSFHGEITVASRIIDYLSSGLYKSPAACLKELINNSYDADATIVHVFVKPDANRIIIEDNGTGLDRADFERHFKRISESHKREDSEFTERLSRPKIGKIGIGFIAANEICDVMEIASTKAGSPELLEVSINFALMREDPDQRKRAETEFAKANYFGTVSETNRDSHFTQVFLKEVRGEAKAILSGAGNSQYSVGDKSLYGLKPETVCDRLQANSLRTWSQFDAYSRNKLEVGLNIPVAYHENWLPSPLREELSDIEQHVRALDFSVAFDGSELRKPIVFNPTGKCLVSRFHFEGKYVGAKGYFYAQHGGIKPQELQGLLIRIRNAAVGEYDPNFLGFSSSIGPLFQKWISAEVMADDRLEDAMNIDRRTLRVAHPAYVELQAAIHTHMDSLIKRVRAEIYGSETESRKQERAEQVRVRIVDYASKELMKIAPVAARTIITAWVDTSNDETGQKNLLQKYSVDSMYQLVLQVAREILTPQQFDEFVVRLTERIKR